MVTRKRRQSTKINSNTSTLYTMTRDISRFSQTITSRRQEAPVS